MELEGIKQKCTWNDAVERINSNFAKIRNAILSGGGSGGGGGESSPSTTYIHEQGYASSQWTIYHFLGKYPSVTIVDSSGMAVMGEVTYSDENKVIVTFSSPFSGKAYLN